MTVYSLFAIVAVVLTRDKAHCHTADLHSSLTTKLRYPPLTLLS